MRVVGGRCKGRRLAAFRGASIRPTSDKVREAIFNILPAGFSYPKALDLFAGTGAMGIEAMSRGASEVVFVDADPSAVDVIKKNLETCGLEGARVVKREVLGELARLAKKGERFDIIFVDPPYNGPLLAETVEALDRGSLLAPGGVLVAEGAKRAPLEVVPASMELFDKRNYGDTAVYFYSLREAS